MPVPCMELELEDDIEADDMCEEDAGEEVVLTLLVLLAAWVGAEVGGVQGLVGTAIVTT